MMMFYKSLSGCTESKRGTRQEKEKSQQCGWEDFETGTMWPECSCDQMSGCYNFMSNYLSSKLLVNIQSITKSESELILFDNETDWCK